MRVSASHFLRLWNSSTRQHKNILQLQLRTLTVTTISRHEDKSRTESPDIDERIHKAIAGTRIRYKEENVKWVGYNPFKQSVTADWMSFLSQKVDWESVLEDKWNARQMEKLRGMQSYSAERRNVLGGELAAARFVVAMNGKVKLHGDEHFYTRDTAKIKSLPTEKTAGLLVETIDLSNTQLLYDGVENLFQAQSLVHLNLSNCSLLDEWSISRLGMVPSLVSLDLSNNPFITERCLIPLKNISNLQRLNLRGIKYFVDVPLPLIFLEELLPNCVISTDADT